MQTTLNTIAYGACNMSFIRAPAVPQRQHDMTWQGNSDADNQDGFIEPRQALL